MPSAEVLREVKRAEQEAERLRAQAKEDADRILREAARDAEARRRKADEEAHADFEAGIAQAQRDIDRQKQDILRRGQQDAQAIAAKANGPALDGAVDILLKKFDQRVRG